MGFHPTELIFIFVVALLVFGPKKLPEIGSQMGRTLNAFKKGMRDIQNPLEDSFDLETFTSQHREIKALEARRLELEILERELAVKRAEAELRAVQQTGIASYDFETTVHEDYVSSETIVDADYIASEEIAHSPAEPIEAVEVEEEYNKRSLG